MSNLNHARPELVYRDNLRRELGRVAEMWPDKPNADAPPILKPFAERQSTLNALGRVLKAFNDYLDEDREIYSLTPPADAIILRYACREFANARMSNPYDRSYSVHDWLRERVEKSGNADPFYKWLFDVVEAA